MATRAFLKLVAVCVAPHLISAQSLPSGCVAFYSLSDSFADMSGNGAHLTAVRPQGFVAGPPAVSGGGTAAYFNRSFQSYAVSASLMSLPSGNAARSMVFWLRVDSFHHGTITTDIEFWGAIVVGWGHPSTIGQGYIQGAASVVSVSATGYAPDTFTTALSMYNNDWYAPAVPRSTANVLEWHHYALTYDGSTACFYLDGVLVGSGALSAGAASTQANTPLYVGFHPWCCWGSSVNLYLTGAMARVGVFSRALSQGEVVTMMNASVGAPSASPTITGTGSRSGTGSQMGTLSPSYTGSMSQTRSGSSSQSRTSTASISATRTGTPSSSQTRSSNTGTVSASVTRTVTGSASTTCTPTATVSITSSPPICRGISNTLRLVGTSGSAPQLSTLLAGNYGMYTSGSCSAGFKTFFPGARLVYSLSLGGEVSLGGTLTITTCGVTSNNTVLYVGTGCPTWMMPFGCLVGNDDAASCSGNALASTVTLTATQRNYFVQLGGIDGTSIVSGVVWNYTAQSPSPSSTRSRTSNKRRSPSASRLRSPSTSRSRSRKPK